jgi:hypothetical protein
MTELGMLIYPWDVQADGVNRVVETAAELGVNRLDIACAYHSAEVLSPRRSTGVFTVAEANRVHLPLRPGGFSGLSGPPSSIAKNDPELYPRLRTAAEASGIALGGWGVAFHNSELAVEHPDAAILNCFGDRFSHGLCAANPLARTYAVELFESLAATGLFDRVLAESVSYLLYGHGHPHELWGARFDVTTRYLSSLCFCDHCVAAAHKVGIEAEGLRVRVAAELRRTWNGSYPGGRTADEGAELTSLLLNWPDLAGYTRVRMDTVTSLVTEIVAATGRHGTLLDVSAAVWGRPATSNWLEGVDVSGTLAAADGFLLESYFPTTADVAAEIDHTQALAVPLGDRAAELSVALTLWPAQHASRDVFLAKVRLVRDAGIGRLLLYNYGTATQETLGWVAEAAGEFLIERRA